MDEHELHDNITIALELNLMTQEQVVSEFRELLAKDLAVAAIRYDEFTKN